MSSTRATADAAPAAQAGPAGVLPLRPLSVSAGKRPASGPAADEPEARAPRGADDDAAAARRAAAMAKRSEQTDAAKRQLEMIPVWVEQLFADADAGNPAARRIVGRLVYAARRLGAASPFPGDQIKDAEPRELTAKEQLAADMGRYFAQALVDYVPAGEAAPLFTGDDVTKMWRVKKSQSQRAKLVRLIELVQEHAAVHADLANALCFETSLEFIDELHAARDAGTAILNVRLDKVNEAEQALERRKEEFYAAQDKQDVKFKQYTMAQRFHARLLGQMGARNAEVVMSMRTLATLYAGVYIQYEAEPVLAAEKHLRSDCAWLANAWLGLPAKAAPPAEWIEIYHAVGAAVALVAPDLQHVRFERIMRTELVALHVLRLLMAGIDARRAVYEARAPASKLEFAPAAGARARAQALLDAGTFEQELDRARAEIDFAYARATDAGEMSSE